MSKFDRVIGYETIKEELMQICDMVNNREVYENLGAKLPRGVLMFGDPGLGKTLMANCFIEESGLKATTIRKNKSEDDFVNGITEAFEWAKENSPCIVFLDDLDKFANEDSSRCNTPEYVAVQAGIDAVKGYEVLVFATANDIENLPSSLLRAGRFDRKIFVKAPTDKDAKEIIAYYFKDKKISVDVNMDDFAKMISYSSCAELETLINEAAVLAAFDRRDSIEMKDLIKSVRRKTYEAPDSFIKSDELEVKKIALHEAGHLVVSEILIPESIGFASVRTEGRDLIDGFVHTCKSADKRRYQILIALAGKAAVELYYSETVASGCHDDLDKAIDAIKAGIMNNATSGLGLLSISGYREPASDSMVNAIEATTHAELERYMVKTKEILLKNRDFLEKIAKALEEKETLLFSEIQAIKESTTITPVAI